MEASLTFFESVILIIISSSIAFIVYEKKRLFTKIDDLCDRISRLEGKFSVFSGTKT